jgi:DNA polymerase III subunit gamma/tau
VTDAIADIAAAPYRVLARKYRPRDFRELIGQDALVRTLSNAIQSGRIAQAFMLTGVRGVGKTTTARIIARALNCTGPDGTGGPTIEPCGVCDNCRAIAEDRHVDVMEMDAASHTGVDDIREIIDGVRYAPVSARFKLYIVDEVHMLSRNAFNALLKTLEEPPAHVKFVFATTEIRKVPVTVLSRCQRFDLRRVDAAVLKEHFTRVTQQEGMTIEPDAAALIARAADGSVRDGLSLLDQAIALAAGAVTAEQVRDMLGLADRTRVIDLFDAAVSGKPAEALDILSDLHRVGADPLVILQDLLDLVHNLTRLKVVPDAASDPSLPEDERTRGGDLSRRLGMPALTRAWQLLMKGLGEVQAAPVPQQALEMVIVRMAYLADVPTPGDLIRQWQAQGGAAASLSAPPATPPPAAPRGSGGSGPVALAAVTAQPLARAETAPAAAHAPIQDVAPMPRDFRALVQMFADNREGVLYGQLCESVHPVRLEPGRLTIRPEPGAPPTLANRVGQLLTEWTGQRWVVAVVDRGGEPTLAETARAGERKAQEEMSAHPLVKAVMAAFDGAKIVGWRDLATPEPVDADTADPDDMAVRDALLYPQDEEGEF